jgi:CheY-like chemotaxis protein
VATRIDDDRAALEVRDSGVGIAPELMPRIFDLFVQGAPSLDRPLGGLGLGLTLASRLAALHGGGLTAASQGPGQGSTFTLRLPRMEAPAVATRTPEPVRLDAGRNVVLVEDNADLREMMRMHLELDGHTVIEAVDGRTGVEAILAQRPDVALIDIGLPEIDGYEVARSVRARQNPPVTYLVALTGYGQADDKRRAREAGFDAHLIKPVTPEDLEAAIAAADGRAARQP